MSRPRMYLSPWKLHYEDESDPETNSFYAPEIYEAVLERSGRCRCLDLRAAEEQLQVPAQGYALVEANLDDAQHLEILAIPGTVEILPQTKVSDIQNVIGDEGLVGNLNDNASTKAFFQIAHRARVDRWQGRS